MDNLDQEAETRISFSYDQSSAGSFSKQHSLSFTEFTLFDDATKSESLSEAGDFNDRALHNSRLSCSESGSSHFSLDNNVAAFGIVVPIQEDKLLHNSFPSASVNILPSSDGPIVQFGVRMKDEKDVHMILEYVTCLLSLAVFGILGISARYGLQKLFGPDGIGATSDRSYVHLHLPSNMVGSFLMGWLGVVFKEDISKVSYHLALGLTTGFLGSLATFSGWTQKMINLSIEGHWAFAVLGTFIGLFLVAYSIIFGIETASGFKWLCRETYKSFFNLSTHLHSCNSNKHHCLITFMLILILILGLLWGSILKALVNEDFETAGSEAQFFLACMVGPFGVWIRWFLARFNGRGIGKHGKLKWIPLGTLAANVLAACVMAALETLKKAMKTKKCHAVASGVQFGLLGCLGTVPAFIAEFHAMRKSPYPWRAYAYAAIMFIISFFAGTLIYTVPILARPWL